MAPEKDHPFEYKLTKKDNLSSNFFRLLWGINNTAISLCNFKAMKYADNSIHEIRKTMKKSRSILKLYRTATGEDFYVDENALFRDISRNLSQLRVSAVRLKTVAKLKNADQVKMNNQYLNHLINDLQAAHKKRIHEMIAEEKVQRSVAALLRNNRHVIRQFNDFPCDFAMLSAGLKKMYRRCTVNLNMAMNQPSAESIHGFRKPVKYLWNQMILLRPIWPLVFGQIIRNLDRLGERLGDEHDLAELEQYLWSHHYAEADAIEPLVLALRKERKRIQRNVWPLSMKVFAETPAAFAKRIFGYWSVW